MRGACAWSPRFKMTKAVAGTWNTAGLRIASGSIGSCFRCLWPCGGSRIWLLPVSIMATVIASIAMIDATKASFGSDAYGSWISCVAHAPLLPSSIVYRSRNCRLDGASLCVSKMCQGERWILLPRDDHDSRHPPCGCGRELILCRGMDTQAITSDKPGFFFTHACKDGYSDEI